MLSSTRFHLITTALLLALGFLALASANPCQAADRPSDSPQHERVIRAYFSGWEQKDWNLIASLLTPDFTFTSPTPDDHLSIEQFRAKCWNQAQHIARFEFPRISGDEHSAFAIVHVITTDQRIIRNIEYFTFRDGRIAAIEVFFGGTGAGFPTRAE